MTLDETDRKIVVALQQDARLTNHELGELLHLSASQAGRRRQRLEAEGVIAEYRAHVDPARVGLGVQAFVQVELANHERAGTDDFLRLCHAAREVVSVWTLTGDADYLLRVYCSDLERLNRLVQNELVRHASVARVRSQIVLDHVKEDTGLPV